MAKLIQALRMLGPQIKHNHTVQQEQITSLLASRTSLNKSEINMMIEELAEAILYFNAQGTPVKLNRIGTFSPTIDRNGAYKIKIRPDRALWKSINRADEFSGEVQHRRNIGLDNSGYKAQWDALHPDDPLEE
jgi:hypothetical protein